MKRTEKTKPNKTFCVKTVKCLPVIFILAIIMWSYYAYVVELCVNTIETTPKMVMYIIFFHIFFIFFTWSYLQTILTDIARVPNKFKLPQGEYERLLHAENEDMQRNILETFAKHLPLRTRTMRGSVRYCDKCRHIKPDRAHHCSVCGECVLKMDHHCPWINNCVNYSNYKFFMLFLAYSYVYCIYICTTSIEYFIEFWKGDLEGNSRFHILFLFFVALMFTISLVSLFGYHCYLVVHNRTTLEAFTAPMFELGSDKDGFNLGKLENFIQVFGEDPKLWFIPVQTSLGDGYTFPVRKLDDERVKLLR